jgi:PAS domain S-box-containing protein
MAAVPDLVMEADAEGRYLRCHSEGSGQYPIDPHRVVGKTLEEVLPPDVAAGRRVLMAEAAKHGTSRRERFAFPSPMGTRFIEVTVSRAAGQGNACGYLFLMRDVTDQVAHDRMMRRLGNIAKRTSNVVVITDNEQRIEWVNTAYEKLTGYGVDEVRGRKPHEVTGVPEADKAAIARIRRAVRAQWPVRTELLNRDRNGRRYWIEMDIQPLIEEDGSCSGFVSVQTDVTERKAQASELERLAFEAEQARIHLQSAIDALPDAFVAFDANDRLSIFNQKYVDLYPRSSAVVRPGVHWEEILKVRLENGEFPSARGREAAWAAERRADHRRA